MNRLIFAGATVVLALPAGAQTINIPDVSGLKDQLSFLQRRGPQTIGLKGIDSAYDAGTSELDQHRYEDAVATFNRVIEGKGSRADGALYWKAYALNRIGRRDEGLAALATLRRDFASSRWLNDAQALEVELKQGNGQAVTPAQESNEDIKLMAINSLMGADPDRAIPLLEGVLKSGSAPRVKERALFVLTQNRSARARQILLEYAKGAGNPDLQMHAIRYLGMSGTTDAQQDLGSIYSASNDVTVKREIIRSLMMTRGKDAVANIAKTEKDENLRKEAIRQLGPMRATDQLVQLYASETNPAMKKEIISGLMVTNSPDKLIELARKESDPTLKRELVSHLASMHSKEATDYMMELLK